MSTVIKAENLGKKYIIGHQKQRYDDSFRDAMTHTARGVWQRIRHPLSPNRESVDLEELWALKDINFEVQQGERVGIIGRNGAGKSTLLKILSRITEPTTGKVRIKGRVSSLLEVGTGFHPELTGRENIFLNGAILGMTRQEVKRKFDEIIAFAELEKFLDTPVKRYSSGMYVRLAFAVAAHLEPEILLVDEVLAVGDASFQKKCLGKMENVAKEGRTILFVSHNMEAIRRLCPKAILIADGHIVLDGASEVTIGEYLSNGREQMSGVRVYDDATAPGDEHVRLRSVRLVDEMGNPSASFRMDQGFYVEIEFFVLRKICDFHIFFQVIIRDGAISFTSGDWDNYNAESSSPVFSPGLYRSRCEIPKHLLNHGSYRLALTGYVPGMRYVFANENVLQFKMSEVGGAGAIGVGNISGTSRPGIFRPQLKWTMSNVEEKQEPIGKKDKNDGRR